MAKEKQTASPRSTQGGNRKLQRGDVPEIKSLIASGESLTALGRMYGVGYQAMYRLAKGETWTGVGAAGDLIQGSRPERRFTTQERDKIRRTKLKKGWSNAKLARIMGVSESTIARAVRDAEMVMAFKIQRLLLTSGSHDLAMETYKIPKEEAERLTSRATGTRIPRHLRKELET